MATRFWRALAFASLSGACVTPAEEDYFSATNAPGGTGGTSTGGTGGASSGGSGGSSNGGGTAGQAGGCGDPSAAQQTLDQQIAQIAAADAPLGAISLGTILFDCLSAGATIDTQILLQPNKCYTFVGLGLAPIVEVNLRLLNDTGTGVLVSDEDQGSTAVVGRDPYCYKNATPTATPVKVLLEVVSGSGFAGAQVFESGCTMANPAPTASPCTSDSNCLTHKCNLAAGRCAYPCQSDCDCTPGNHCNVVDCVPN